MIFHDANGNRAVDDDEPIENLLEVAVDGELRLNASGSARHIRYYPHGGANPFGSFIFCPRQREARLVRRVTNQMAGRAYMARPRADGSVPDTDQAPIRCGN